MAGTGRMGRTLMASIASRQDLCLASIWVRDDKRASDLHVAAEIVVSHELDAVTRAADVLVDFSLPEATNDVLAAVVTHDKPLVCGVSGLSERQLARVEEAARSVAVVYDRNMSLGIAVLENLVRQAAAALGSDFAAEVHETHHVHKVDAPSGTALKLGEAIAAARDSDPRDIRYEVERRGEVPGEHAVILASATERLTLAHSVTTRQVFADGALHAARWVVDKPPGRYSIRDVLQLSGPL
ncbi:MAG: 4-hydroxy-tetrahydrodipicolinate reductase [Gammaproteobacteria bacterium]|nr:4-hydroxy-tetrahydrodipicolinate reductase [Gammaproteobacteria bacterium]MDH3431278.1 4-hydroxy-tetrahydrodipicolinate reductase [Gammaproteobacteria bacterium]